MSPDELERLSREDLLELLRRHQEELAERDAAIERLDAKIRELEEELAQFRRPAKTAENSSLPPSRGQKANRVERRGRQRGPKRGHRGISRRRAPPDVVVRCRPTACRGCGAALLEAGQRRVRRSQVVEVPGLRPMVVEAWGSDAFPSQLAAPAVQHQLCLSHQIRDLTYAIEVDELAGQRWTRELRHVFGRALRLHRERERVTPETFAHRQVRIERAADRLIFGPPLGQGEAWQLQKRYRKHWDKLFVCLHHADIEPTNNSSERDPRNAVIHEKVSGGYRSQHGAEQGAIFTTILTTARKRGQNPFEQLCTLAGPSPLQAASTAT